MKNVGGKILFYKKLFYQGIKKNIFRSRVILELSTNKRIAHRTENHNCEGSHEGGGGPGGWREPGGRWGLGGGGGQFGKINQTLWCGITI